jgi:uncharacterized membrane protein YdjX (TVP38/TMEM64 family)
MAKMKRRRAPLYFLIAGIFAFVAGLNFIMGSPIQKWIAAAPDYDEPLFWAVLLMLVVAIVPIVVLVSLGEDDDRGES